MLQYCCGYGDCCDAGVPNMCGLKKREMMSSNPFEVRSGDKSRRANALVGGSDSLLLVDEDGNKIPPMAQGLPFNAQSLNSTTSLRNADTWDMKLNARSTCEAGSWVDEGEEFMTTGSKSEVMTDNVLVGPATVTITKQRSSSWSTSMEASIGFAYILSLGISFSVEQTEEISSSQSTTFQIPDGQTGYVLFTPYVRCKKGESVLQEMPP
jgi:hypothetical protein